MSCLWCISLSISLLNLPLVEQTPYSVAAVTSQLLLTQAKPDLKLLADQFFENGNDQYSRKQYREAIDSYQKALTIHRQRNDWLNVASTLNAIGVVYYQLSFYAEAIDSYQKALFAFEKAGRPEKKGRVLNNLGVVYDSMGHFSEALEFYQKALQVFTQANNLAQQGKTLDNMSFTYYNLAKYYEAISQYEQALAIRRRLRDRRGEGITLHGIGNIYLKLGQDQKAIDFYQQSFNIFKGLNEPSLQGFSLIGIGLVNQKREQYLQAIEFYQQALMLYREAKNSLEEGRALSYLGTAYTLLKNYPQAINTLSEAVKITRKIGDRQYEGKTLDSLGIVYRSQGDPIKATEFYQQALAINRQTGDSDSERITLSHLGDLFRQQNQSEFAILLYKQSVNVTEVIRRDIRSLPPEQQESYTRSVAGTYRALADLLIAQGRIGEAQQVLERLKIQELNDFTKGTRAPATIADVGFNSVETQIKGKYTSLIAFGGKFYECEQLHNQQQNCPQYSELKTQYQSLSKEFQDFVEQIKQQLREGRLTQVDKSAQDFQNSADRIVTAHPNSILIYPLVLADKTLILWAFKGGVLSKTAICPLGEKALYNKVSQFQKLISQRGDETQLKAVGKDLYDCLIKPLEGELTANQIQHLIFVPDRATNYIPMGALFDGKQYLIQRFAVSNILSAGLTDTDDKLQSLQQTSVLALGITQAKGNFGALPNVEAELNAIVKQKNGTGSYPGDEYLNQAFTKAALEDNIRGHRIIHIATHGEFKPENPRGSYFLLGTGDPYPIPDVQTLRNLKDVHLVVLSACQTGLGGADGSGLEVTGMSSFFMGDRDRAKAVIASLWQVNDISTSLLMQQFYQNLATGKMSKVEALRQAQLALIRGNGTGSEGDDRRSVGDHRGNFKIEATSDGKPSTITRNFSHPYYWAPFILIGNGL